MIRGLFPSEIKKKTSESQKIPRGELFCGSEPGENVDYLSFPTMTCMIYKEYVIRAASNNDIPAIKKIVLTCLTEYGLRFDETGKDKDLNDIEKNYLQVNGFFGVAVYTKTNHIVGTFGLCPLTPEICELRKMYLLKESRGQGVGQFILRTAIQTAKEKQYHKIFLETISPLTTAISLYKKCGFTETKPREINERTDQAFELYI